VFGSDYKIRGLISQNQKSISHLFIRMRIGIEAQRLFRIKKHGMDVVALELIKNLQEIDSDNEYFIFSRNKADQALVAAPNFHTKTFSALTYGDWEQIKLPAFVRSLNLSVLHCTANTAPLKINIPLILTLHDIIYLEQISMKGTAYQNLGNLYRRLVVPKNVKKAELILTVSEFERQNIVDTLKIPEKKIEVLYNGVGPQFNNSYGHDVVRKFKEDQDFPEQYVLFLGNTAPKKNTINVVKAFARYADNVNIPIPLVLLDYSKALVQKLLEEIKQPHLIKHFIFPGYVSHQQMPLVYAGATLFLYPSLRESFGLPILEAMACGVPVITSDTSSMPEVAGNAAILIDPHDVLAISNAIMLVLSNEKLKNELVLKGLQRAAIFSWKASAQRLLDVYKKFG
jgi:glycosyltransferase involved in cell wall biosynthesis